VSLSHDPRAAIEAVPARGYRWWYVDGLSDDGRRGYTAIFMVGSCFSPWLASRAWRGEAVPAQEHLGVHVALYEDERPVAWTMTEYGLSDLEATSDQLRLGSSSLRFEPDGSLTGSIDELTAPPFFGGIGLGARMRGRFRFHPGETGEAAPLELGRSPSGDAHHWHVRAPHGRLEVDFERPGFRFTGRGYHDTNWGEGRLEEAFVRWSWARFHEAHRSRILYAVTPRQGEARGFVLDGEPGRPTIARAPGAVRWGDLVKTGWGLSAPLGFSVEEPVQESASVVRWLDRTPFYARYVAKLEGIEGVGEYLDLDRFQRPTVQFLLRWRMQRRS